MAGLTKNADKQNRGRNGHNRNREQHRSTERVGAGSTLARKADQYYHQRPYSPHNFHKDPNIVYGVKTDSPPVMARLKIGQPNDKYEQEADAVADKVVNAPAVQQKELPEGGPEAKLDTPKPDLGDQFAQRYYDTRPFSPHNFHQVPGSPDISSLSGPSPVAKKPTIQRDVEPDVQEKEEIGPDVTSAEPRLDDSDAAAETPPPGDLPSEGGDAPVIQQKCETCGTEMGGPETTDSQGGDPPPVQQKCAACEADGMAQMSAMGGGEEGGKPSTSASPEGLLLKGGDGQTYGSDGLQSRLNSSKGSGDPLPDQTRSGMEDNIGADFGNVRVHTGADAVQMSQDIGAQAFTHGSDIYFNEGKYQPETSEGKHLLAHELTHTVQQGAAPAIQQRSEAPAADIQAKDLLSGLAPDMLQRAEEVDEEELKKQLEDSEDEREKAIDPLPAQREEKEALKPNPDLLKGPDTLATDEIGEAAKETAPGAEGEGAPAPEAPAAKEKGKKGKGKPEKDPTLGTVGKELAETSGKVCPDAEAKTGELAANEKKTDSPEDKLAQTEGAVVPPAAEGQAMGNAGQVETVEGNPAPEVSEQEAKAELQSAISSSIPSDVDAMNKFKSKGKGEVVGAKVMGKVNEDVDAVKGTYNEMEQAATPEPPSNVPKELPPTEVAAETPEMNLGEGAVPELSDEQTDMSNFENESDEQMKKEGITDEQLEMVDSGDLAEAKKERKGLKKKVKDTPGKLKEEAKAKAKKVDQDAKSEEKKAKADMRKKRDGALAETQGKQQKTKTELEKKREAVTNHINGIYDKAKKSVTKKLENLESVNKAAFKVGQAAATRTFENEVNADVKRWKRKRYSGIFGGVKWLKDKLFGIADFPEIKNAFERAKKRYIERIDQLIATINAANQKVIADCKQELADAKKQIKEYVDGLGPELKAAGQAAQKEMAKKLEEMNSFVDKKQKELVDKLCKAKDQAIKDIDKKIEKMKSEMSGLIAMLGNLLLEALKKFFEWALTAVGKDPKPLLNILDKGAAVIKALFGDPIGFIKNLVGATKKGIDQFKANIKKHLISGLVGWLTGAMSEVSITLPEVWDLKGILHFILQLLGLTWENLRAKLVKRVGEKVVSMAETGVEIVKTVINEGPIGLWNWVKEKASDIKAQVFAGIRNYVITNLVKKGILKLVSMLNPAGAIVQAIIGIFDTVMFFVENWDSILDFVNSIFDSISNIAAGKIGAAANFIEATMAKTIPIILNFLGKFIGLSGIGKAVQSTVKKIRKPVDKAMDKGLDFMENAARKLFGKKTGKKTTKKGEEGKISAADEKKHKQYISDIKKELKEDATKEKKAKTFTSFYGSLKKQIEAVRKKYQAKLKKGIKLTIAFGSLEKEKKDNDLDLKVKIAPNDSEDKFALEYDVQDHVKWEDVVSSVRDIPDIKTAANKINSDWGPIYKAAVQTRGKEQVMVISEENDEGKYVVIGHAKYVDAQDPHYADESKDKGKSAVAISREIKGKLSSFATVLEAENWIKSKFAGSVEVTKKTRGSQKTVQVFFKPTSGPKVLIGEVVPEQFRDVTEEEEAKAQEKYKVKREGDTVLKNRVHEDLKSEDRKQHVEDSMGQKVPREQYRYVTEPEGKTLSKAKRLDQVELEASSKIKPDRGGIKGTNAANEMDHVKGMNPSIYISATKTGDTQITGGKEVGDGDTEKSFNNNGRITMDMAYIEKEKITDVSTEKAIREKLARQVADRDRLNSGEFQGMKDVRRTEEVLIKDKIPKRAITDYKTKDEVDRDIPKKKVERDPKLLFNERRPPSAEEHIDAVMKLTFKNKPI